MCGGPSEVDDELEPETVGECAKYGPVVTCMIYQVPDAGDGPEAVRIFVEFENAMAAARGEWPRARFYADFLIPILFVWRCSFLPSSSLYLIPLCFELQFLTNRGEV